MAARTLLVEGKDDEHVAFALLKKYSILNDIEINPVGGIRNMTKEIQVRLEKQADLERLAVIVDADTDAEARWRSIAGTLRNAGVTNVPTKPDPSGYVVDLDEKKRFGLWIMPDNTLPGAIEKFVSFLVPEDDPLMDRVDDFLADIPASTSRFAEKDREKARIHSWLAIQKRPGTPMGQAITVKYLDGDAQAVAPFIDWINRSLIN